MWRIMSPDRMTKSFIRRAAPHSIFGNMIIRLCIKDLKYGPQKEQYSNKIAGAFTSGLICNSCPSGVILPPNGTKGGNYKCRYITKRICQNIQNAGTFELLIVLCHSQTELLTRSCFRESCIKSNYPKKIMAETHKLLHIKLPYTGTQHLRGRNVFKRGSFYCGYVAAHGPGIAGGHNVF